VWVPGHCGIHENKEAVALARAGSSSAFVRTESSGGSGSGYLNHTAAHGA
jgi:hypothetical protein